MHAQSSSNLVRAEGFNLCLRQSIRTLARAIATEASINSLLCFPTWNEVFWAYS